MEKDSEFYIDPNVHSLVEIVYRKNYYHISNQLKTIIQNSVIRLDAIIPDSKIYVPAFDYLVYPTVVPNKNADDYNQADWEKWEEELGKSKDNLLPTYQYYKLGRLTNDLLYLLKIAIHGTLNPEENVASIGFSHFVPLHSFICSYFPDTNYEAEYEDFWCRILENIKTDQSITRLGFDNRLYPLGLLVAKQIDWLKARIDCG